MKSLDAQLSTYATYHRDRRNIATHFVGIPLIVLGIQALLARAGGEVGGLVVSAAMVASALAVLYYLVLDLRFGLVMAALLGLSAWAGTAIAAASVGTWLAIGGGLFVGGWAIQFVGHLYEGKKPAFVDDLIGLLIGPLFIVAEAAFALGLRPGVRDAVERSAGPTYIRGAATAPAPDRG